MSLSAYVTANTACTQTSVLLFFLLVVFLMSLHLQQRSFAQCVYSVCGSIGGVLCESPKTKVTWGGSDPWGSREACMMEIAGKSEIIEEQFTCCVHVLRTRTNAPPPPPCLSGPRPLSGLQSTYSARLQFLPAPLWAAVNPTSER